MNRPTVHGVQKNKSAELQIWLKENTFSVVVFKEREERLKWNKIQKRQAVSTESSGEADEVESWLQPDVCSNYSKANKDYRLCLRGGEGGGGAQP